MNTDLSLKFPSDNNVNAGCNHNPVSSLVSLIESGKPEVIVSGLKGAASSYFASRIFSRLKKKHIVIIASTQDEAQRIYDETAFFLPYSQVLLFPPFETKPYENVLSHSDISSQRIWTLYRICDSQKPVIVIGSVKAFLQKVLPSDVLIDHSLRAVTGSEIDREEFCRGLVEIGYASVSMVQERGDMSIRGELIDLFPSGMKHPVRIDFFGDVVETIKLFDPATQRSIADVKEAVFVPVRDVILSSGVIDRFFKNVEEAGLKESFSSGRGKAFFESIINGFMPSGVEYCSAFIYGELNSIFDFFGEKPVLILKNRNEIFKQEEEFKTEIEKGFNSAVEERRVASPPASLFLDNIPEELQKLYFEERDTGFSRCDIEIQTGSNESLRRVEEESRAGIFEVFTDRIQQWLSERYYVHVVCHTKRQCERLQGLLSDYNIESEVLDESFIFDIELQGHEPSIHISTGNISRGFQYEEGLFVLVSEEEIFGEKRRRTVSASFKKGLEISDFSDLKKQDPVVHRDNGIGKFRGLVSLQAGGAKSDFILIEYANADKLYLPVDKIHLINKYEGV